MKNSIFIKEDGSQQLSLQLLLCAVFFLENNNRKDNHNDFQKSGKKES